MSSPTSQVLDTATGKAQLTHGESFNTFLASLTTATAILGVGVVIYTLLRIRVPEVYSQRAYRISRLPWKPATLSLRLLFSPMPDPELEGARGFDNYLFDRYLHTIVRIFVILVLTILPILLPLNAVAGRGELGGVAGLDILSFSNVSPLHTERYWAHLVLGLSAAAAVCYIIRREIKDYDRLRMSLTASAWDGLDGCSSVLLVSEDPLPVKHIQRLFRNVAGGVRKVTVNRDYSSLRVNLRQRDALAEKLEVAVTKLITTAGRQRKSRRLVTQGDEMNRNTPLWKSYVHPKDRPSMRLAIRPWLPPLPYFGSRVDTIYYLRRQIAQLDCEILWAQQHPGSFPSSNSAIISFNQMLSTPLPVLALKVGIPPHWTLKHGTDTDDMIWQNMSTTWRQLFIRGTVVYLLVTALILGFAFPVTVAGTLSQLQYLAGVAPWLSWVDELPTWLAAALQGVLPQTMVALVTALAPIALRLLANTQGLHSRRVVENHIQIYYFAFLFVQVFLTVSLSAGVTTIVGQLSGSIESVPEVLALNLPKASNYFLSYTVIQTFTTVAYTLLQITGLFEIIILSPLLDNTARQKWVRRTCLDLQQWSTLIPVITNIACIGLTYSVIAPLILLLQAVCFGVLWILYRFYPPRLTERGIATSILFYPTAIRQLLTGVYFMELCLAGLFFLVRDGENKPSCTPQAAIMLSAVVVTALFHYALSGPGKRWPFLSMLAHRQLGQGQKAHPAIIKTADLDDALRPRHPVLWIPRDDLGVSTDEIFHAKRDGVAMTDEGACLERGGVKVHSLPLAVEGPNRTTF